jgi:pyrimidine operon attenuation protein / uracil phosphoribosyltransferase
MNASRLKTALDRDAIDRSLKRLAHEILEKNRGGRDLVFVGIVRRGADLAHRLARLIKEIEGADIPVGTIDISLYRDDGKGQSTDPRLLGRDIAFTLDHRRVVLVDDVLYTGRTVRAALEALSDLGRPDGIQLAVLIDRGERELPIRADYVGKNIQAPAGDRVYVKLAEIDGIDAVLIGAREGH